MLSDIYVLPRGPETPWETCFCGALEMSFGPRSPLKKEIFDLGKTDLVKEHPKKKHVCVQKLPCSFCFILFLTCVRHSCVVLLLPVALKPCLKPFSFLLFVVMDLLNSTQLCLIQLYVVCSYKLLKKNSILKIRSFWKKNAIVMRWRYLCIKNVIEETRSC